MFATLFTLPSRGTIDTPHSHHDTRYCIEESQRASGKEMAPPLQFIVVSGEPAAEGSEQRKLVRAHAMRDFRRKQQMQRKSSMSSSLAASCAYFRHPADRS